MFHGDGHFRIDDDHFFTRCRIGLCIRAMGNTRRIIGEILGCPHKCIPVSGRDPPRGRESQAIQTLLNGIDALLRITTWFYPGLLGWTGWMGPIDSDGDMIRIQAAFVRIGGMRSGLGVAYTPDIRGCGRPMIGYRHTVTIMQTLVGEPLDGFIA